MYKRQAVAYLEPGGKHLRLFDAAQAPAVVAGLRLVARDRRDGELRIEKVNGDPALRSEHAGALEAAGMRVQPGALVAP